MYAPRSLDRKSLVEQLNNAAGRARRKRRAVSAFAGTGHVTAEPIEDLERAIDFVLHGVVRSLRALGEFMGPLQVHRQPMLDRPDAALDRFAKSISRHLGTWNYKTRATRGRAC